MEFVARVFVAAVLGLAGFVKAVNFREFRQSVTEFGVPPRLVSAVTVAIPTLEIALAVGLLWPATTWPASIATLALLSILTLALVVNLARGRRPNCRCFGRLQPGPINWPSVGRNCVLLALSGLIVLAASQRKSEGFGRFQPLNLETFELALIVALAGGVALAVWLGLQVLRQNGRLLTRLETLEREMTAIKKLMGGHALRAGLPIGSRAPAFRLSSLRGERVTLEDLLASGRSLLLVFVDPDCSPCQSLTPDFERWDHDQEENFTLTLLSRGKATENRRKFNFDHRRVLLQTNFEVAELYRCVGTPGAVLISPDGYVRSELAIGTEGIKKLVDLAFDKVRVSVGC